MKLPKLTPVRDQIAACVAFLARPGRAERILIRHHPDTGRCVKCIGVDPCRECRVSGWALKAIASRPASTPAVAPFGQVAG